MRSTRDLRDQPEVRKGEMVEKSIPNTRYYEDLQEGRNYCVLVNSSSKQEDSTNMIYKNQIKT